VILARQRGHAQASPFIHGRYGSLWIRRGVSDHHFEWPPQDPAAVIHFANRQLKAGKQVLPRLDPAGPAQRDESADPDGTSVGRFRSR
jgi:hypothetical protein